MVRIGCMVLAGIGLLQVLVTSRWAFDPEGTRCTFARVEIESANDDDEDFNDVELPDDVDDVDDLSCEQAVELASSIPAEEGEEPEELASVSQFRLQGMALAVVGLAQVVTGILLLRTLRKGYRTAALAAAAAGILLGLGFLSLIAVAFVVFALVFSRDAKETWGGGSFMRPRPPSPEGA